MLCFTAPEGRVTALAAGAAATAPAAAPRYARHAPERTLLYALVQAHYPDFLARLEAEDRSLPAYVREEFDAYLRCGVLDHGFLRVVCEHCHADKFAWSEFEPRRLARRAEGRMPGVEAGGLLLQEAWLLPELRRAAHGRVGAPSGG